MHGQGPRTAPRSMPGALYRTCPVPFVRGAVPAHDPRDRCGSLSSAVGAEDGLDEGVGVERLQILDLLAHADEAHRQLQFTTDGDGDSALGGAVELGQYQPGDAHGGAEDLG